MDPRMMSQLMETYGFDKSAPVSARNANMIRQFAASNPDVLERRAMGMRGSGVDDNSDLLDSMLERVMQESAAPQSQISSEPLAPPVDMVQTSGRAPARAPTARQPSAASPQDTAAFNEANVAPTMKGDLSGSQWRDVVRGDGFGIDEIVGPIIGALLGTRAVAGVGNRQPQAQGRGAGAGGANSQNVRQVEGANPSQKRLTYNPSEPPVIRSDAGTEGEAKKRQLQVEIDSENDALMRQIMAENERRAAQKRTQDLGNAAKRATGRK